MNSLPSFATATPSARFAPYELLGQLAGTVTHDFNNVLAAISGSAGLIEFDPSSPHTPRHLENIRKAVQRGAGLLHQFQYFNPRNDGPFEPVDLGSLMREITASLHESFGSLHPLSCVCAPELPPVKVDVAQVRHVILSLASNARDALPRGGGIEITAAPRTISAEAAACLGPDAHAGTFVVLAVRDGGTGIAPEVRARLCEPFFTTKAKGKGFGLGLATVARVVHRHGGFLHVDSDVGCGTTVECFFLATPSTAA